MRSPTRRIGVSKLATVSECVTAQGTHVAVKHYDKQPLSTFQHDKIFHAATRWQALSSPGLISYLEVLPSENQIIMEMMERSAAVRLSEGYSDPRLVNFVLRGVLSSLTYLHEQGLLHLNIKPTNVFFDEAGRAKLSDGLLVSASAPGTLPPPINQKYLTPEHTSDAFGPMSVATDLYAVGFLALELLAGERFGRAFQGIGDDTPSDDLAWFQWHGSSQETPLATQFCKTCPPQLEAVIARLTKKNPAERYANAQAALAELPPETPQPTQAAKPVAAAPSADVKRPAFASDVLERPATGVVLAIASGPRAGEMFGTNDTEFFIGFHPDCLLRFSQDQYPYASSKVMCRRTSEGWMVSRVIGENTFVNQRLLEDKLVLRSGDVIRLTARGPDVQFTMQSGGLAIKSLVSRFLPAQNPAQPNQSSGRTTAAPGVEARVAPRPPGSAVPTAPASAIPTGAAPRRPGSPAEPRPAAPVPAAREPVAAQATAAPKPPSSPAGTRPGSTPSPAAPVKSSSAVQSGRASKSKGNADGPKGPWTQPKTWNKNQKNTAIAVIGGLFVILLVVLIPTSPSKPPENLPEKPAEQSTEKATEKSTEQAAEEPAGKVGEAASNNGAATSTDGGDAQPGELVSETKAVEAETSPAGTVSGETPK